MQKKLFRAFAVAVLPLVLWGCGEKSAPPPAAKAEGQVKAAPAATTTTATVADLATLKSGDNQPLLLALETKAPPLRPADPAALPETDPLHWYDMEFAGWSAEKINLPPSPKTGPSGKKVITIINGDHPYLTAYSAGQQKAAAALGRPTPAFPPELATLLLTYAFPGNVRELEAMVADAVSRHPGRVLSMASFKNYLLKHRAAATPEPGAAWPAPQTRSGATLPTLKEAREQLVEEAMKRAGGNQTIAAGMLGLTRTALNKRLRKG